MIKKQSYTMYLYILFFLIINIFCIIKDIICNYYVII
nr:MAG TPA: hypothetical protein [Bacteriophage sp.]